METNLPIQIFSQVVDKLQKEKYEQVTRLVAGHRDTFMKVLQPPALADAPSQEAVKEELAKIDGTQTKLTSERLWIMLRLSSRLHLNVLECVRLVDHVKRKEPNVKPVARLYSHCLKTYYENRDYIISAFLRVIIHFSFFPAGTQRMFTKHVFNPMFKKNIVHGIVKNIAVQNKSFFAQPKAKYQIFEMIKLMKILYFLSLNLVFSGKEIMLILKFHVRINTWFESLTSHLQSKVSTPEFQRFEGQMIDLCYISALTFLASVDPYRSKYSPLTPRRKVMYTSLINDENFIIPITMTIKKIKNYLVKRKSYFGNGIYGMICATWSVFLNEKFMNEDKKVETPTTPMNEQSLLSNPLMYHQHLHKKKSMPHFKWRMESLRHFQLAVDNSLFKFMSRFISTSLLYSDKTNIEFNFFMNSVQDFIKMLFLEKPRDRLAQEYMGMYRLLKEEEDYVRRFVIHRHSKTRVSGDSTTTSENNPDDAAMIKQVHHFENIMEFLFSFYKKEPKFGRKIFISNQGLDGFEYFAFAKSTQFVSDLSQLLRTVHQSFDFYLKFLSALCRDEYNGDKIQTYIQRSEFGSRQLFSWNHFFGMIKTLGETKNTSPNAESKIVSILRLIYSLLNNCPSSKKFFCTQKDFKIVPSLFKLTTINGTSPRLIGQVFKTLGGLVTKKDSNQLGNTIWNYLESLKLVATGAMIYQFDGVETVLQEYHETTGILFLLEKLTRIGIPENYNNNSFYPYYWVIENVIFRRLGHLKYKNEKEKWKMICLCLRININLVKYYHPQTEHFKYTLEEDEVEKYFLTRKFQKDPTVIHNDRGGGGGRGNKKGDGGGVSFPKSFKSSSFEIMRKMLTMSENFVFKIQKLIKAVEHRDYLTMSSKEKRAILLTMKFIWLVLTKQESFRFHGLQNQQNTPVQFLKMNDIFNDQFIFDFLIDSNATQKIQFYSMKIFLEVVKNEPKLIDLFIAKDKHLKLMKIVLLNIRRPRIRNVLLDVLILNTKMTVYLCGYFPKQYYAFGNPKKNVLTELFLSLNRVIYDNSLFVVKSLEFLYKFGRTASVRAEVMNVFLENEAFFNKLIQVIKMKKPADSPELYLQKMYYLIKILSLKIYTTDHSHITDLVGFLFKPVDELEIKRRKENPFQQRKIKILELLEEINEQKFGKEKIPLELSFVEKKYVQFNSRGVKEYDISAIHKVLVLKNITAPRIREILTSLVKINEYQRKTFYINQYYSGLCELVLVCLSGKKDKSFDSVIQTKVLYEMLINSFQLIRRNDSVQLYIVKIVNKVFVKLLDSSDSRRRIPKNQCIILLKNILGCFGISQRSRVYVYMVLVNYMKYTNEYIENSEFLLLFDAKYLEIMCKDSLMANTNWRIISLNSLIYLMNYTDVSVMESNGYLERFLSVFDQQNESHEVIIVFLSFFLKVYNRNYGDIILTQRILKIISDKIVPMLTPLLDFENLLSSMKFHNLFIPTLRLLNAVMINFVKNFDINNYIMTVMPLERFIKFVLKNKEYSSKSLEEIDLIYSLFFLSNYNPKNNLRIKLFMNLIFENFKWYFDKVRVIDDEKKNGMDAERFQSESFLRRMIEKNFIAFCRVRFETEKPLFHYKMQPNISPRASGGGFMPSPQQQQQGRGSINKFSFRLLFRLLKTSLRNYHMFSNKRNDRNFFRDQMEHIEFILENVLFVIYQNLNIYLKKNLSYGEDTSFVAISQNDKEMLQNNCGDLMKSLLEIKQLQMMEDDSRGLKNEFIALCSKKLMGLISNEDRKIKF